MAASYDAVVVGALGVSTNVVVPAAGRGHGVEATFTGVLDCIGQAGGDTALGFAALGCRTAVVGHVGDDRPGDWVRAALAAGGVDVRAVDIDPAGTARSVNLVAPDGSRHAFYDGRGHRHAPVDPATSCSEGFRRMGATNGIDPVKRDAGAARIEDLT